MCKVQETTQGAIQLSTIAADKVDYADIIKWVDQTLARSTKSCSRHFLSSSISSFVNCSVHEGHFYDTNHYKQPLKHWKQKINPRSFYLQFQFFTFPTYLIFLFFLFSVFLCQYSAYMLLTTGFTPAHSWPLCLPLLPMTDYQACIILNRELPS